MIVRPYYSDAQNVLYNGDALTVLKSLPNESLDTCLTSPPYWGARDYGSDDQIGLEAEVDQYISNIVKVFNILKRKLKRDRAVWLNIGDSYYNKTITVAGLPPEHGWKRNKQLMLIPFKIAIALQEDGWWLRNTLAWHKTNPMN